MSSRMIRNISVASSGDRAPLLLLAAGLALASLSLAGTARAADTVETFDAGALDLELYFGVDGLRRPRSERAMSTELVAGYGIAAGFSAYVATSFAADGDLGDADRDLRVGVVTTVLDGALLDLDLMLEGGGGGPGLGRYQLVPAFDMNVDAGAGGSPMGLFLRAAAPMTGEAGTHLLTFDLVPGARWVMAEGHELVLEWAFSHVPRTGDVAESWESGGASLGYNVGLSGTYELITQATVNPGAGGQGIDAGVMLGVIATVPGVGG